MPLDCNVSPLTSDHRLAAALLYWDAFQNKLRPALGPGTKAVPFLETVIRPEMGIAAYDGDGALLGVVGFKSAEIGGFVAIGLRDLVPFYGWFGAIWRGLVLELFDRPVKGSELILDGICVAPDMRGRGIGSLLLDAVLTEARKRQMASVRLDVIDSNPRARLLYERYGFVAEATETTGLLAPIMGFRSSTRLIRRL